MACMHLRRVAFSPLRRRGAPSKAGRSPHGGLFAPRLGEKPGSSGLTVRPYRSSGTNTVDLARSGFASQPEANTDRDRTGWAKAGCCRWRRWIGAACHGTHAQCGNGSDHEASHRLPSAFSAPAAGARCRRRHSAAGSICPSGDVMPHVSTRRALVPTDRHRRRAIDPLGPRRGPICVDGGINDCRRRRCTARSHRASPL
jgi:hypothetical protein